MVVVAETELSQLASMRLMELMMVVVAVVISTRKFHPSYDSRTTHLDAQDELINGLIN